ncbi:AmmeMemoRadiSam system protein B [Roseospirillum parvum]|uniref:MEMO1 family protein SAMN05421742_101216 n=1 Tax=Roseospirillum parvum TaxID=83401 RepID=A0A1G7U7K9_9PROT|nr:AmmeMemoRadiSam system protein B [Roseospirillum parvum]SDG42750.1 hypothetical protein SAMN05421742_101216 [Roseospirillum parvum]
MTALREPAVAGRFYPAEPELLSRTVRNHLAAARAPAHGGGAPKALIAPHAGYPFSGPVAGSVYARLAPLKGTVKRVILLGPSHRVAFKGMALSALDGYATPLGPVAVDGEARALAAGLPGVGLLEAAHGPEHSLEVHLPFLMETLDDFTLLPVVCGDAPAEQVAALLDTLWGGPETLIVISTDLSHYLDAAACRQLDDTTVAAIERLDPAAIGGEQACGRVPLRGLLTLAKRRGMTVETVDVRHSGDTAGPKDRVVGYGAFALYDPPPQSDAAGDLETLMEAHGAALLELASGSIAAGLAGDGKGPAPLPSAARAAALAEPGASFVTLTLDGRLRGCIGSPTAHRRLDLDVWANAWAAAFGDPRFAPLSAGEWPRVELSVSVLSRPEPFPVENRADLLARLRPGVDGLILSDQGRRALFLPQVWAQLPEPGVFLEHLLIKAGLPRDHWSAGLRAERFIARSVKGLAGAEGA